MTISEQVDALESLDAADAELKELNDALASERAALERKRDVLRELKEKLDRSRASIDEMERTRGELVSELRQLAIQVDKSREKLSRCRTEREVNAAQREVEELRKLCRDRELDVQKLGDLVQQARGEFTQTEAECVEIEAELGENEGEVATRLTGVFRRSPKAPTPSHIIPVEAAAVQTLRANPEASRHGGGTYIRRNLQCMSHDAVSDGLSDADAT